MAVRTTLAVRVNPSALHVEPAPQADAALLLRIGNVPTMIVRTRTNRIAAFFKPASMAQAARHLNATVRSGQRPDAIAIEMPPPERDPPA